MTPEAQRTFVFASYRNLYRYLGETDAMIEVAELAVRAFLKAAKARGVEAFVKAASEEHGLSVHLSEIDAVLNHLSRTYIVTVCQSAERFFHDFRREHIELYKRDWSDRHDADPLTVTLENIAEDKKKAEDAIGHDLITRLHYYRLVRNWVVHTKDSKLEGPLSELANLKPYSTEHEEAFGKLQAPNRPDKLTFDDFILFTRVLKALAEKVCLFAAPTVEQLRQFVSEKDLKCFKRLKNNPARMQNAVVGRIKTDHRLDDDTAEWLAKEICGLLA